MAKTHQKIKLGAGACNNFEGNCRVGNLDDKNAHTHSPSFEDIYSIVHVCHGIHIEVKPLVFLLNTEIFVSYMELLNMD